MKINPVIFKAYDIRGIYPREITEEIAFRAGRAFVQFLAKKKLNIVVGSDNRFSSPQLKKNLIKGLLSQGANVVDVGLSTTPMLYFAVAHYGFDGGIEITSSHNPPQYNGFKMVREEAIPLSEKSGVKDIKELVIKNKFQTQKAGQIIKKNILEDYLKFNFQKFDFDKLKKFKIIIDTGNAVSGILIPALKKKLTKIFPLFLKLDSSFPNHQPDPLKKENLVSLCREVLKKEADLGLAFDGDGDRIIFVSEKGEIISADLISVLISQILLKEKPGLKILFDIRSSRIIKEVIKKNGGKPILGRVGHSFIKEKMRKENIYFAGEFSGHYYLKNNYFCEAPLFVLFSLLEEMAKNTKTISELIKPFQKYFHSEEINFKVQNKEKILNLLEKRFGQKGQILKIDGLRIDFPNWWFCVRPSQTEPLLRMVLEAKTKELLEKNKKELSSLIEKLS